METVDKNNSTITITEAANKSSTVSTQQPEKKIINGTFLSHGLQMDYEYMCKVLHDKAEVHRQKLEEIADTLAPDKFSNLIYSAKDMRYSDVETLIPDKSTSLEKVESLIKTVTTGVIKVNGNRLERRDKLYVLQDDKMYRDMFIKPKAKLQDLNSYLSTTLHKNTAPNLRMLLSGVVQNIPYIDAYMDNAENLFVVSRRKVAIAHAKNYCQYGDGLDVGVSVSYIPTKATEPLVMQDRIEVPMVQAIQLSRYDPYPSGSGHHNKLRRFQNSETLKKIAGKYFDDCVYGAHFHFGSLTDARSYGIAGEADAISLDSLLTYCQDLKKATPVDTLARYDLGIPFYTLKKQPSKYVSSIEDLKIVAGKYPNNKELQTLLKETVEKSEGLTYMIGLDAVIKDLKVLEILHSMSSTKSFVYEDEQRYATKICLGNSTERVYEKVNTQQPKQAQDDTELSSK